MDHRHVLRELVFPTRFEQLAEEVGPKVASVLQAPSDKSLEVFRRLATATRNRKRGSLLPMFALSGTGKTTLANALSTFLPIDYRSTVGYEEATITFEALEALAAKAADEALANESRILPILLDDREGTQPSTEELAAIKKFLRRAPFGTRSLLLWPDTDEESARTLAAAFEKLAGKAPVESPLEIQGPEVAKWPAIAVDTLTVVNQVGDLPSLGVNPDDYDPNSFATLGLFLERISEDFIDANEALLESTRIPLRMTVLFASESYEAGILSQLTNSSRGGLVDGSALIDATKGGDEGRYWSDHRSELTRIIYQLDVHAYIASPSITVPLLRAHGDQGVRDALSAAGVANRKQSGVDALSRSDFGLYLAGTARATSENRGTPPGGSISGFKALAAIGLSGGKDKAYNASMLAGMESYIKGLDADASDFHAERKLDWLGLVPDNQFVMDGTQYCIEYAWNSGDFTKSSRAGAARYILKKLKNYNEALHRS